MDQFRIHIARVTLKLREVITSYISRICGYSPLSILEWMPTTSPNINIARLPKTLVVIPFKDKSNLTIACINSFIVSHQTLECIKFRLVSNNSRDNEIEKVKEFCCKKNLDFEVVQFEGVFNYSAICNFAVSTCSDVTVENLFFLNNDIEIESKDLLLRISELLDKNTGAVGCRLLYPDRSTQHIFLAPGVKIVGAHPLKGTRLTCLPSAIEVPAVTGAAMLTHIDTFNSVNGFDEMLPSVGQDLDFCLKVAHCGYKIKSLLNCEVIHFEGASRKGKKIPSQEVEYIYQKWGKFIEDNPGYPQNISRWQERPVIRLESAPYPWRSVIR
ncbi:glycosyltransferase family 2 protein [Pseudobacteriovorax antillogorgiicola]|uniref:Glycosyltransferase, GT2 family n=1 Tax=Pseudobacteriovorax antillogorgiicola TaxID=1513793 RepID=A0A1Y6B742_9BACT|nr:glycosyltransferase [Pseudobacteriovorax antillogorgiicola]TCS59105.1 GT2 family glycosyltransferase [Pseudobacteriovorax antillogorgiicola]SME91771.1 Glycosyltransferase, GT2 family [Pseudobacteriovorax antillogorgiicola]